MNTQKQISLPDDLWRDLDSPMVERYGGLSMLVESLLRAFVSGKGRKLRDARELVIINANAEDLNKEAEDALTYQVEL
jgi:metal-responsive CopG/Arc/MetJ family transcriptional regulator